MQPFNLGKLWQYYSNTFTNLCVTRLILLGPSVSARLHTLHVGDVESQMARLVAKTSRGQKTYICFLEFQVVSGTVSLPRCRWLNQRDFTQYPFQWD